MSVLEHAVPSPGTDPAAFERRRQAFRHAADADDEISPETVADFLDEAMCGSDEPVSRVSFGYSSWLIRQWVETRRRPTDAEILAAYELFGEPTRTAAVTR